ncbi:MAG: DUF1707 domain-containing protein [Gordonia sp. (in: high G+C Gram-positive bacteria)]
MTQSAGSGQYYPAPVGDERRAATRATDADREQAHSFLSAAMTIGALSPEEYTDRAANAVAAVTLADLDVLCADLPLSQLGGALATASPTQTRVSSSGAQPVRKATSILSSSELGGGAVVAESLKASTVLGGVDVDLRDVEFTAPELAVKVSAVLGTVRIVVPPDVTVEIHGSSVAGGFDSSAAGPGTPGAPRIVIRGRAVLGSVEVVRLARGAHDGPKRPR